MSRKMICKLGIHRYEYYKGLWRMALFMGEPRSQRYDIRNCTCCGKKQVRTKFSFHEGYSNWITDINIKIPDKTNQQ